MTKHFSITKIVFIRKKIFIHQHSNYYNGLQSNITIKYIYINFLPKVLHVATTKIKSEPEHHKHQ